ncbi:MAG: calcium/sodium antiporter [Lachnospiraceae bacterium]|nr:calcium/sodium antiporter [Lachnospiraceae bacterium]
MVIQILLFLVGFVCLVKGGDWFVDASTGIAHRFHMPEILIGATVVSIGTTIPEVMVSATGAITGGDGGSAIAYGNAIGSIICNTSLIAAITMAFRPAPVEKKSIKVPIIFFFCAAAFYVGVAYITGYFSRIVGVILLAGFVAYIILCIKQAKASATASTANDVSDNTENDEKSSPVWKDILFLILGAAVIAVGANLLVDNGTKIAETVGVPHTVIALTFVALGTSLPELVTAITSLIKGHSDLSLGNIIGANLFNLVLVSGVATTLAPFKVPCEKTFLDTGMNSSLLIDIPLMLIVMLIMCLPPLIKGKIYRWQGILLMVMYFSFCIYQFVL